MIEFGGWGDEWDKQKGRCGYGCNPKEWRKHSEWRWRNGERRVREEGKVWYGTELKYLETNG